MVQVKRKYLNLVACMCIMVSLVLFFLFLLRGETKITGEYPENDKSETLVCTVDKIDYPFLADDGVMVANITVRVIFKNDINDKIYFILRVMYF